MLPAVLTVFQKEHWWRGCRGTFLQAGLNTCSENSFHSTIARVQLLAPGALPVGLAVALPRPCHLELWPHLGPPGRFQPKWSLLSPNSLIFFGRCGLLCLCYRLLQWLISNVHCKQLNQLRPHSRVDSTSLAVAFKRHGFKARVKETSKSATHHSEGRSSVPQDCCHCLLHCLDGS